MRAASWKANLTPLPVPWYSVDTCAHVRTRAPGTGNPAHLSKVLYIKEIKGLEEFAALEAKLLTAGGQEGADVLKTEELWGRGVRLGTHYVVCTVFLCVSLCHCVCLSFSLSFYFLSFSVSFFSFSFFLFLPFHLPNKSRNLAIICSLV